MRWGGVRWCWAGVSWGLSGGVSEVYDYSVRYGARQTPRHVGCVQWDRHAVSESIKAAWRGVFESFVPSHR